jgi:hypothetical protein
MGKLFRNGDFVHVAKDLGPSMSHFEADCDAIVIGSYADQYGGKDRDSYTIHIKGLGEVSWYYGHQLTLIKRGCLDKLREWEEEEEAEIKEKGDLDWIFANGKEVLADPHGASLDKLAECLGLDLWGASGEGMDYYCNAMAVLQVAKKHLLKGDKEGWLKKMKGPARG